MTYEMHLNEAKNYEKRMNLMTHEERAEAEANGGFYSGQGPKEARPHVSLPERQAHEEGVPSLQGLQERALLAFEEGREQAVSQGLLAVQPRQILCCVHQYCYQ